MTSRGIGLVAAVVALWVVARSFGIEQVQMAAVAALVLLVCALAWSWLRPARLVVHRTVTPSALWFDGAAEVRLDIRNTGRLPSPEGTLEDRVPHTLVGRTRTRLPVIRPGRRIIVSYRLHGRQRGHETIGPARLTTRDPFGLTTRTRTLAGSNELTVYPPIWHLPPGLPLGGATTTRRDGRRRTTSGDELADVREYVRGDDLRAVHWPSTAHRGKLMVRRTESTSSPAAVVVLDRRAERHVGDGPDASFETAVAAAASASYHLSGRGRSLVLLDTPLDGPPASRSWEGWLEHLATVTSAPVDLEGLLRQVGDGAAGDGALVVVVAAPTPAELRTLVRAGRGFSSRAALVLDVASHGPGGPDPAATAAAGALRAAGWRATVLERDDRLDDRWQELVAGRRTSAASAAVGR